MTTTDTVAADTTVTRQAWLALSVTTLVTFLVVIDISAVNVAFPSIQEDFDASRSRLIWIVSGYNVTVGALLMFSGRLADSLGRKKVFLPGLFVFMIGSACCGLAPSVGLLIAARVLQAIGGAVVTASSFAVMLPDFPPARRSTAIGIAGGAGALGAVAGPAVGSLLIDLFNWRAIFWINVPICLLVLIVAPKLLNESSDPNATGRIDGAGVLVGTAAVSLLLFGIVQSEEWGVSDPRVIALVIVGLLLFPVLIQRSRVHPEPLINLDLFGFKSFRATVVGVAFYGFAFGGGFLLNSMAIQDLWGESIRTTGLALMPSPLVAAIISPLSGVLGDRFGHRWLLGAGAWLCAIGYGSFALFLGEDSQPYSHFVPLSLISGVGIGLTVATWSSAAVSDVPNARFGVAGSTYNTVRQAAYALGVSVVITLVATGTSGLDLSGYRLAWIWCTACYFLSGVAIMALFPSGSSHDRDLAS